MNGDLDHPAEDITAQPKATKRCAKCGCSKLKTGFYKDASRSDGLDRICKGCRDARNASTDSNAVDSRRRSSGDYADSVIKRLHLRARDY